MRKTISTFRSYEFDSVALAVFRYQAQANPVYKEYMHRLGINPDDVNEIQQIPFLPIEFFKTHNVYASEKPAEIVFTSSGTTGQQVSRHAVADLSLYRECFFEGFERAYGLQCFQRPILALLPSYLEREGSSLVYMIQEIIARGNLTDSGFYLHDLKALHEKSVQLTRQEKSHFIIGVTYALLDLAEQFPVTLPYTIVMETGGMKGKRKELVRDELHTTLKSAFRAECIHSEYGMTELLSQAYSFGEGIFMPARTMRVLIREMNDPFAFAPLGKTGGINIIDLGNLYSCSFIATSDLGKLHVNNSFEVLGRFDNSDVRGCNLMVN
ncbi:MAG: acyl transferase [Bacteroidia bacterium]